MPAAYNLPQILGIDSIRDETPTVRTLYVTDGNLAGAHPGQFAMVWVPGAGELPMSIMVGEGGGAAFTVRRHGPSSTALYNLGPGGLIGVRGPYGNSFDIRRGRLLLVGGGTGLVPLMRLITRVPSGTHVTLMMGARTREEVFFEDTAGRLLRDTPHEVRVCTDDGSYGTAGLVTDAAASAIAEGAFDAVYSCGPELMMHKVMALARDAGVFAQASIERMMKCGTGICGSCCMGGELVCRDGTVFGAERLLSNPEFGVCHRSKAGIIEPY